MKGGWKRSLSVVLLAGMIGCGREPQSNVSAHGVVAVDGMPLSGAVITLEPLSGTTGPNTSVPVFDGEFVVPSSAGLHGGNYRVRVSIIPWDLRRTLPPPQSGSLPPADAVIDPAFDSDSQLTCTLEPHQSNSLKIEVGFL